MQRVTQVIVHLAKHFGNILVLLVLLSEDWRHVPDHHLARILSWKKSNIKNKENAQLKMHLIFCFVTVFLFENLF